MNPIDYLHAKTVMDVNAIMEKLPQRYPFLMVDKIVEVEENRIVGIKQVTINEGFFQGHFPKNPIFPGVLQLEAMGQVGGVLALLKMGEGDWNTYFVKIDNCKFKDKVVPGDSMVMVLELMEPIRRGIVKMKGKCFVGEKLVSEGELTAIIQKQK